MIKVTYKTSNWSLSFKVLLVTCNKRIRENWYSQQFTNFKEFGQFSRKNFHFQGFSRALEMTFQIHALSKGFKDLHEPCKEITVATAISRQNSLIFPDLFREMLLIFL